MIILVILFEYVAYWLTAFIIGGTMMGVFPIEEIFTLILPVIMWGFGKIIKYIMGLSYPKFLDTKIKKVIAAVLSITFGFLCNF